MVDKNIIELRPEAFSPVVLHIGTQLSMFGAVTRGITLLQFALPFGSAKQLNSMLL